MSAPMTPGAGIKAAAAALFLLFLAAAAELTARVIPFQEDEVARITAILRQDPELFWTQKPGLDTEFAGTPLKTNSLGFRGREPGPKKPGIKRIVLMGASPAFGWGVREEDSYAALLERALAKAGKEAEVINASVIGYSSWQGLKLLDLTISGLKPDLLIVAYGVNDVDKYRFFRTSGLSDRELGPRSAVMTAAENFLASSRFVALYRRLIFRLSGINRDLYGAPGAAFKITRRVPEAHFAENLSAFAQKAAALNIRVLFVTSPFISPLPTLRLPPPGAAEAETLYHRALLAKGEERAAWLKKVKAAELYDCYRLMGTYNETLRRITTKEGLAIADLEKVFSAADGGQRPVYFLAPAFDFVHFSPEGHKAAASLMTPLILKMLK